MTTKSLAPFRFFALTLAALTLTTVSRVGAQTTFLADTFDRPDNTVLDAATNGLSGLLISSGALAAGAGNIWVTPDDNSLNVSDSLIAANQVKMGGNGHTVQVFPNFNFANLLATGTVSVSVDLKSAPTGSTANGTAERYVGIAVGFSFAEGNSVADRQLNHVADLFVDESIDGQIRVYDGLATNRAVNTPDNTTDLNGSAATFIPGTLRVDLTITNTAVGASVTYNVLFNSSPVVSGRSFVWSGDKEFYVGLEERSSATVTNDNFSIAASSYTPPPVTALIWRATTDNNWNTSTTNWVDGGLGLTGYAFFNGANVTFNDTAASASVNLPGAVTPGNLLVNNTSLSYSFSGAGSLGGTGVLTKSGNGTLTLNPASTFSGGTTLTAGWLRVGSDSALGSGLTTLGGGTISSVGSTAHALANPVLMTATATAGDAIDNGTLTFGGLLDFGGGGRTLTVNGNTTVVFAGGSTNGLVSAKQGPGTLVLKGVVAGTNFNLTEDVLNGALIYDGAAVTSQGRVIPDAASNSVARLVITNGASVVSTGANSNLRSGRAGAGSGTNFLDLAGLYSLPNAAFPDGCATLYANGAYSEMTFGPGGDFTANAVQSYTNGAGPVNNTVFKFNGGTLRARQSNAAFFQGLAQALVLGGGANIDDGGNAITIAQSLLNGGGGGGLTKWGAGTLTLSGDSTYTGSTVVSNGTLNIVGSLSNSPVTVKAGALSGYGTIENAVSIQPGATLAPGNLGGTLTLKGGLTLAGDLWIDVNKSVSPSNGMATVSGTLNNAGTGTLTLANAGPAYAGGDVFKVFNKALANGGALTISPALPGIGLAWSNKLAVNGTITVVATGGSGPPADLSSLTVSTPYAPIALTPAFASNIVSYSSSLAYSNAAVTVTPVSVDPGASIRVIFRGGTNLVASGATSSALSLKPGTNIIDISVTTSNGAAAKDYYVNVTRIQPNVVLILADDQGFSDWGCYGSEIPTPNIDNLAATGLRFRNFYNTARCSTTRCSLLTGLYTQQVAVNPTASLPPLRTDNNVTIAEVLKGIGYRTYMAGKWHIGGATGQTPQERGFQEIFTYAGYMDHSEDTWTPSAYQFTSTDGEATNISYAAGTFYQPDVIGDYSLQFLNGHYTRHTNTPFFLYMPFGSAHFPIQAPKAWVDTNVAVYTPGWDVLRYQRYTNMLAEGVIDARYALSPNEGVPGPGPIPAWNTLATDRQADLVRRMAIYAAMIQKMDVNIGRVVQSLQQQGQLENTLIIAISDNGGNYEGGVYGSVGGVNAAAPLTGTSLANMGLSGQPDIQVGGGWAHTMNTPFRWFKHYEHFGGIGSPCVIHWPQGLTRTNQWENQPSHLIDVMATIADVTGATYPTQFTNSTIGTNYAVLPMEGISLKPLFTNSAAAVPRNLGFEHEGNRAYISGSWNLVTKNSASYDGTYFASELELYNLTNDPSQVTNLAFTQLTVLAQMVTNWNNWCNHVGDASSLLITSISNPAPIINLTPAPTTNDLFVDTFNRANNTNIDATATGMWGSYVPPLGANTAYYQGYNYQYLNILNNALYKGAGGMVENGLMDNFTGQDILDAGGFSMELTVQAFDSTFTDTSNRYAGFGVGLTQAQAAAGADYNSGASFRGSVGGKGGISACFVDLDLDGNLHVWTNGILANTIAVGANTGVLLASFACTGFTTSDTVTVNVYFNGQRLDLNPADTNTMSRTFKWNANNSNYLGLSARASNSVQMDNLAIRKLPLVNSLVTDYAMSYGLSGTNAAPDADPDGDGVSNFGEWAFGGNPSVPDAYIASFKGIQVLPGNNFIFEFQRFINYAAAGLRYRYFVSSDLANWTETTPNFLATAVNEDKTDYEIVTLSLPPSVTNGQPKLFLRIMADTAN